MVKKRENTGGETMKCTPKVKQDVRNLLCDKDKKSLTYSDIKKGLIKYHPDKNQGSNKEEAEANYKIINNAKDECYENKNDTNYTISCAQSQQPRAAPQASPTAPKAPRAHKAPRAPKAPKPPKEKQPPKLSKEAECIRQVGTFSHITPDFKMDKRTFKPKELKEKLPVVSPKLLALIEKIKELDKADYEKDKQTYKHCIYIDFKGTYAKTVAAALLAYDFTMAYDRGMVINEEELLETKGKNFAFLSSSTIYDKVMKVPFRKQIIELFNRRPENIHGEYIRYIVLDSGFREGLDLFDTKSNGKKTKASLG